MIKKINHFNASVKYLLDPFSGSHVHTEEDETCSDEISSMYSTKMGRNKRCRDAGNGDKMPGQVH